MEKTFTYENGTVTVHGWERWPQERIKPIVEAYITAICNREEERGSEK